MAPDSVRVPAAFFVRPPVPERMAEMVPLTPVTCATGMVPPLSVPPPTVSEFVSVRLLRLSVPPLTAMAPPPKAAAFPAVSVPAVTVVPPP